MTVDFFEIARARLENNKGKYLASDGRNAAYYRNNILDVIEELADGYNICLLMIDRLMEAQNAEYIPTINVAIPYAVRLAELGVELARLMDRVPAELLMENVDRSKNEMPTISQAQKEGEQGNTSEVSYRLDDGDADNTFPIAR